MTEMVTIEKVYGAVEELITELRRGDHAKLAAVLDHRLHKIAWTSGSELLEELRGVLSRALASGNPSQSPLPIERIEDLLRTIAGLERGG